MSRIGKMPIEIPAGITVTIDGSKVVVKGPKAELTEVIRPEIKAKVEENHVVFTVGKNVKNASAYWGLARALVANMVKGVNDGFEKKLELVGVGYRAKPSGNGVTLTVGFSHPVEFPAPEGIKIEVVDQQNIVIKGADKQLVGLTAAKIRKIRKPEPYKGKGIKYAGEVIRRKAGKSGKV